MPSLASLLLATSLAAVSAEWNSPEEQNRLCPQVDGCKCVNEKLRRNPMVRCKKSTSRSACERLNNKENHNTAWRTDRVE